MGLGREAQRCLKLVRIGTMEELTDAEVDELFRSLVDESTFWGLLEAWHIMEIKLDEHYAKASGMEKWFPLEISNRL